MVSVFWALFDQHSSTWIQQAEMMDRNVTMPFFGSFELLPSQIPALNPFMVMALIPIMSFWGYPLMSKFIGKKISPLQKMSTGMFVAAISFVTVALIQKWIDEALLSGQKVEIIWQVIPYLIITLAEVMVSITGLEFAYSQAPKKMKSTIMGFWLLTVALGNVFVGFLARFSKLALVDFFWVFAGLMAIAAFIFSFRAHFYKYKEYSQ